MPFRSTWQRLIPIGMALVLFSGDGFGSEPILDAAKSGDRDAIHALITDGADVDTRGGDGSTPLQWACYRDDLQSTKLLLEAGADVDAANDLGVTALWAASQNGSTAIVGVLLNSGADPNVALLAGETPLMVASRAGFSGVVELLLAHGANPNAVATRGQTALMWAAGQSQAAVVELLLAHGADVGMRTSSWSQMMAVPPHGYPGYNRLIPHGSNTALLFAARVGDLDSVKLLLAAGADANDVDAWGVSATTLAAHSGFGDVVEYLLAAGADPNLADSGFNALHIAILRRDQPMARALLAHGANPNAPIEAWTPTRRSSKDFHFKPELVGATPFWLAARFHQPEVLRLLAQHGADPLAVHRSEYVGKDGLKWPRRIEETTPLMAALGLGGGYAWVQPAPGDRDTLIFETVQAAVELGVDVDATDLSGKTALDTANARRNQQVADFLAARSASK